MLEWGGGGSTLEEWGFQNPRLGVWCGTSMTKPSTWIVERTQVGVWKIHPSFRWLTLYHSIYPNMKAGLLPSSKELSGPNFAKPYLSYHFHVILSFPQPSKKYLYIKLRCGLAPLKWNILHPLHKWRHFSHTALWWQCLDCLWVLASSVSVH